MKFDKLWELTKKQNPRLAGDCPIMVEPHDIRAAMEGAYRHGKSEARLEEIEALEEAGKE